MAYKIWTVVCTYSGIGPAVNWCLSLSGRRKLMVTVARVAEIKRAQRTVGGVNWSVYFLTVVRTPERKEGETSASGYEQR